METTFPSTNGRGSIRQDANNWTKYPEKSFDRFSNQYKLCEKYSSLEVGEKNKKGF